LRHSNLYAEREQTHAFAHAFVDKDTQLAQPNQLTPTQAPALTGLPGIMPANEGEQTHASADAIFDKDTRPA
jgi:hypothetical protein